MYRAKSGLLLPDKKTVPNPPVDDLLNTMSIDEAEAFLAGNKAIQRDMKKAKKAYARLEETIRYEVQALYRKQQEASK